MTGRHALISQRLLTPSLSSWDHCTIWTGGLGLSTVILDKGCSFTLSSDQSCGVTYHGWGQSLGIVRAGLGSGWNNSFLLRCWQAWPVLSTHTSTCDHPSYWLMPGRAWGDLSRTVEPLCMVVGLSTLSASWGKCWVCVCELWGSCRPYREESPCHGPSSGSTSSSYAIWA